MQIYTQPKVPWRNVVVTRPVFHRCININFNDFISLDKCDVHSFLSCARHKNTASKLNSCSKTLLWVRVASGFPLVRQIKIPWYFPDFKTVFLTSFAKGNRNCFWRKIHNTASHQWTTPESGRFYVVDIGYSQLSPTIFLSQHWLKRNLHIFTWKVVDKSTGWLPERVGRRGVVGNWTVDSSQHHAAKNFSLITFQWEHSFQWVELPVGRGGSQPAKKKNCLLENDNYQILRILMVDFLRCSSPGKSTNCTEADIQTHTHTNAHTRNDCTKDQCCQIKLLIANKATFGPKLQLSLRSCYFPQIGLLFSLEILGYFLPKLPFLLFW